MQPERIRGGGKWIDGQFRFELTEHGPIVLDFVNTLTVRKGNPLELLGDYESLLNWCKQTAALDSRQVSKLNSEAAKHTRRAVAALRAALNLRELLFRAIGAMCGSRKLSDADVRQLNAWVARAGTKRRIARASGGRLTVSPGNDPQDLLAPLWSILESMVSLLGSADTLDRLRICEGADCAWAYLDCSRQGNKRWCDMTVCGNRAKARRRRAREAAAKARVEPAAKNPPMVDGVAR